MRFWFAAATARYVYDRRYAYTVEAPPEVQSVTLYGNDLATVGERSHWFQLEAVDHCVEEFRRELILEAMHGQEADLGKYFHHPHQTAPDMAALDQGGVMVVLPKVRGSFVVRKLAALLMKTFQADRVHEEKIDVEQVTLFFRPVYAIEYMWKPNWPTKSFLQLAPGVVYSVHNFLVLRRRRLWPGCQGAHTQTCAWGSR